MSKIDENEIEHRLELISRIEPKPEDTDRAIAGVREALASRQVSGASRRTRGLRGMFLGPVGRFAAAAVLLIAAGYLAGRFSSPRRADMERLEVALERRLTSSVEAAIRKDLLAELNESRQAAFADYHAKLNDELSVFVAQLGEQRRSELSEFATKTFAASNAVTHELLSDLVRAVAAAQDQDREWVTAAMRRIESNRIADTTRLGVGLLSLAEQTRGELTETKRSVAQLASVISPGRTLRDVKKNQ